MASRVDIGVGEWMRLNAGLLREGRPWPGHMIASVMELSDVLRFLERHPEYVEPLWAILSAQRRQAAS